MEPEKPDAELTALIQKSLRAARSGFRFRSGDKIEITVFGHPELRTEVRLPRSLTTGFPEIGDVDFSGKKIREIELEIKKRLEESLLHEAHVSLLPVEFAERNVFITGETKRSGAYRIPPFGTLTLIQLIALAGGFTEDADRNQIKLIRDDGESRREYRVSYRAIERWGNIEMDLYLQPGDEVIVTPQARVYVLGSVNRPGGFSIGAERMTVSKAVALAQGFTRLAAPSKTVVIREDREGKKITFKVPLSRILAFEATQRDLELHPGDVVFVPESLF
jgi:polysaccharide export outer membrane protein